MSALEPSRLSIAKGCVQAQVPACMSLRTPQDLPTITDSVFCLRLCHWSSRIIAIVDSPAGLTLACSTQHSGSIWRLLKTILHHVLWETLVGIQGKPFFANTRSLALFRARRQEAFLSFPALLFESGPDVQSRRFSRIGQAFGPRLYRSLAKHSPQRTSNLSCRSCHHTRCLFQYRVSCTVPIYLRGILLSWLQHIYHDNIYIIYYILYQQTTETLPVDRRVMFALNQTSTLIETFT